MPHGHLHRHLPRAPDFWSGVDDFLDGLNPFADKATNGAAKTTSTSSSRTSTKTTSTATQAKANNEQAGAQTTVTRIVYKTMSQTFDGAATGFTTISESGQAKGASQVADPKSILPSSIASPESETVPSTLAMDSSIPTSSASQSENSATAIAIGTASSTPSTTAIPADQGTSEVSGAAKAGIAIGVLAGILIVFMIVFWAFSKRRKQVERQRLEDDDEKLNGGFGVSAAPYSNKPAARAPRISLRPVTQFLPNLNFDRRTSKGANMMLTPAAAAGATRATSESPWERPVGSSQSNNPNNPFGDRAERLPPTPIMEETPGHSRAVSPIEEQHPAPVSMNNQMPSQQPVHDPLTANGPAIGAGVAAGVAAGAAAGAMTRKASIRQNVPRALDLTVPPPLSVIPPSPAGTEFSMNSVSPGQGLPPSSSAAAIAAAGGPTGSTVHRVQLDFKPTLEDEMELQAGQLVRLLHEYDDGWVSKHIRLLNILILTLAYRLSASDLTALSRAWFPERAYLLDQ
jgi:hypothetical protein